MKLYETIGGRIGPLSRELLDAWTEAVKEGEHCVRCGELVVMDWFATCDKCVLEYMEILGCKCGGTNLCPECAAAGATPATREPKCCPECDSMCPVCSPES